jgi:hypothetical protein
MCHFCFAKKLFDRSLALVRSSAGLIGMMEMAWSSQDHVKPCHQEDPYLPGFNRSDARWLYMIRYLP